MKTHWLLGGIGVVLVGAIAACSTTPPTPETANPETAPTATTTPQPEASVETVVTLTTLTSDIIHTLDDEVLVGMPGLKHSRSTSNMHACTRSGMAPK